MSNPWIGPAVAAGGAALGFLGQSQANATNVKLAREQMRFQERMSNTSVQRHRQDIEAAGFNPMLAVANGGAGASTPIGASARVENAPGAGVTSGLSARQAQASVQLLQAQAAKTRIEGMKVQQELQDLQAEEDTIPGVLNVGSASAKARLRALRIDNETKSKLVALVADHMGAQVKHELASALQARNSADLMNVQRILHEFQINEGHNMSEAQKSWFFRVMGPYLGAARGIAGSLAVPALLRGAIRR